ncbi:MAG TPA: cupin domain-containing protein [Bacillota bacterium]|nr:cupin domain-containing protein [Bacillota bacterium]HOK68941.1 cupin domain-containing protein [Bacillota bacterium]HPP85273.1 cupin domain-containing protein [Bacillota bacterium]
MKIMKNIEPETVLNLSDLVAYQPGQVVSRTLAQNKAVSITLFSFDKGEEISAHKSTGDALVCILDGTADITIGETKHRLIKGQSIVMPAGIPHALEAPEPFKMLLTVVFPS